MKDLLNTYNRLPFLFGGFSIKSSSLFIPREDPKRSPGDTHDKAMKVMSGRSRITEAGYLS